MNRFIVIPSFNVRELRHKNLNCPPTIIVADGFKIFDHARQREELSFYRHETDAEIFAERLNKTRPQIILSSKKEKVNEQYRTVTEK